MKSLQQILNEQKVDLTKIFEKLTGRRTFIIDVGHIVPEDIEEYVTKIAANFKKKPEITENLG